MIKAFYEGIIKYFEAPNSREAWKNHQNLISGGRGLENSLKFKDFFFIFIYTKRIYVLKASVEWNFSQNVTDGGRGSIWNENFLAGKI